MTGRNLDGTVTERGEPNILHKVAGNTGVIKLTAYRNAIHANFNMFFHPRSGLPAQSLECHFKEAVACKSTKLTRVWVCWPGKELEKLWCSPGLLKPLRFCDLEADIYICISSAEEYEHF